MPARTVDGHEERDDEPQAGQREQVEAQVDAVLGVGLADGPPVHPQLDGLPLLRRGRAGEQAEHGGADDHHQAAQRLDGLAVLVEVRLLLRRGRVHGTRPVAEVQAPEDRPAHDEEPEGEQHGARAPLGGDDAAEPELAVPEHLRPHLGEEQDEDDEDAENDQRGCERSAPARAGRAGPGRRRASECHGVAVLVVGNRVLTGSGERARTGRTPLAR